MTGRNENGKDDPPKLSPDEARQAEVVFDSARKRRTYLVVVAIVAIVAVAVVAILV